MSTLPLAIETTPPPAAQPSTKQTCATCRHWHALAPGYSARAGAAGPVGSCHFFPPGRDYAWPRTKDVDSCAQWQSPTATSAEPPPDVRPKLNRAKIRPPIAEK